MKGTRGEEASRPFEPSIESLVRSVSELEARVEVLERRTAGALEPGPGAALEARRPALSLAEERTAPPAPSELPVYAALSLGGQACLVLCGAFLLRALTQRDALPLELGLALGLVYALGWLVVTELFARRGKTLAANVFGVTAALVAFPLVWESATRFGVVAGGGAAALIGLVALPALGVARRRGLAPIAWVFGGLTVVACFALMVALKSVEALAVPLLLVGALTAWFAHGGRWQGVHWPVALGADLYVLHMTLLVVRPSPNPEWTCSPPVALALCLALLVLYLATSVGQILTRRREVGAFDVVQTGAVLLVGFGGAARIASVTGSGATAIAAGALVGGLACYGVAFSQTQLRWKQRRNFKFYAWLAFALTLAGSTLLGEGLGVVGAWSGLGVAGALLGTRFRRLTLHYHGAAYLAAAAWVSGLAAAATGILTLPAGEAWPGLRFPALLVLAAAIAAYLVLALTPVDPGRPRISRVPRLAIALVALLGVGGALVAVLVGALGPAPPAASPATVAATRTVVLSASAVALAASAGWAGAHELRWIVYPLLALGALKLLLEDLQGSSPAALFVAFGAYGLSLIVSQHLLRRAARRREPAQAADAEPTDAHPTDAEPTDAEDVTATSTSP